MNRKRALGLVIRIALSIGMIVVLFAVTPSFDRSEILPDWNVATPFWLLAALALTFFGFFMATVRWYQVMHAVEIDEPLRRLFSHFLAGQFVSNFVPTTVGGDVVRITRLGRDTGDAPASFASVVFERLSGWLVLPVMALLGLAVNPGLRQLGAPSHIALYVAIFTLAALVAIIAVLGLDRVGLMLQSRHGAARFANAIHLGVDRFRDHPRSVLSVLAAAFGYQLVVLSAAYCAARAMGIEEAGFTALMAFLPIVLIAQVLPLGIGGLGIREAGLFLFLGELGVPEERAVAFGLLLYLLTVVCSLVGLPALMFGGSWSTEQVVTTVEAPAPKRVGASPPPQRRPRRNGRASRDVGVPSPAERAAAEGVVNPAS